MNRFELICTYCNYTWQTNYQPKETTYCSKCRDTNIRLIDLYKERIDYYAGSPEFLDEEDDINKYNF